jgi:hypothetical protein
MILERLKFEWTILDNDDVKFHVYQNPEHILYEKWYSRGKIPPLNERVKYLRLAGKPESVISKLIKNYLQDKKDSEKNQKIVDDIFAKFNLKPSKKKILKSVKKHVV